MAVRARRSTAQAEAPRVIEKRTVPDFDRLIHERVRMSIMSALAVNEKLNFVELRDIVQTSDGNISVHSRKLEEAGYLTTKKYFVGRIPRTDYQITPAGRRAFEKYIGHMEALVKTNKK
ncbi:MAG TPA: transcriptional regulator [Thermoanaerobaculia bacterium]|jgi:DNA-binding MarR family transcriptional regulator|nr:transcriptional regulator [Thermoanaerobaculia bacterium]